MSCNVSKYLKEVEKLVKEAAPDVVFSGTNALRNIKRSTSPETIKTVEDYILSKIGGGHNKVYNNPTGNQGYNGTITGVSITAKGNLNLSIADSKSTDRTYAEVSITSGMAEGGQRIVLARGLEDRLFVGSTMYPSGFTDVTKPISNASMSANKYVSHMLIGYANTSESFLAPYVKRWHAKAKRESGLYAETVNLLSTGFGNQELFNKVKAHLFLTGDINKKGIADAATIANESARRNYEILDTELPKLDKKIQKEVRDVKTREKLDIVFGKSGFGNLLEIPGLVKQLEDGIGLAEVIDSLGASKDQKEQAGWLKEYYVDRKVGPTHAEGDAVVEALAALYALEDEGNYEAFRWVVDNRRDLYVEIKAVTAAVKELTEVVNNNKQGSSFGTGSKIHYRGYDGNNVMDVYDKLHEFKVVSAEEIGSGKYDNTPWKVLRSGSRDKVGLLYREAGEAYMEGLGANQNRIMNGVALGRDTVAEIEKDLDKKLWQDEIAMNKNNITYDMDNGYPRYRIILSNKEFDEAGGKRNIAHTLMRTYVHNKGLIETETVRKFMVDKMTIEGTEGSLAALEERIKRNKKAKYEDKQELKVFIKSNMDYKQLEKSYPEVAKLYKTAENLSNYGDFDKEIKFVRRDLSDMVIGHKQTLVAGDESPNIQKWERVYKQLVQLLKLKMVVANPAKLATDMLSNTGILMTMDVGVGEVYQYGKEAVELSSQMSKLEGELVAAKFKHSLAGSEATKRKVEAVTSSIENHPYYDAVRFGFIQSMGTSMVIKEFDTISGLQNTIDDLVKKLTQDKKGNETNINKAIKWWMKAGFGANDILDAVSNISKVKGTRFADELIEISERLKDKKQTGDTVRYVSEFIAAPSSELVRQGSRAMQMGDAMARWTIFKVRVEQGIREFREVNKRKPNAEEVEAVKAGAGMEALETFIDYRLNMPSEIKMLSDYGVLMFPSFWMRAQKIIWGLAKYHPLNASGGYLLADALNMGGASIMDANVVSKIVDGRMVHGGQDVLDPGTFILGAL